MQLRNEIKELPVALTVDDFEQAIRLYRDGLGLAVVQAWATPEGRGMILAAGRAMLELIDGVSSIRISKGARPCGTSFSARVDYASRNSVLEP